MMQLPRVAASISRIDCSTEPTSQYSQYSLVPEDMDTTITFSSLRPSRLHTWDTTLLIPTPHQAELSSLKLIAQKRSEEMPLTLPESAYRVERSVEGVFRVVILEARYRDWLFSYTGTFCGQNDYRQEINPKRSKTELSRESMTKLVALLMQNNLQPIAESLEQLSSKKSVSIAQLVIQLRAMLQYSFDGNSMRKNKVLQSFHRFYNSHTGKYDVQCDSANYVLYSCLQAIVDSPIELVYQTTLVVEKNDTVKSNTTTMLYVPMRLHAQVRYKGEIYDATPSSGADFYPQLVTWTPPVEATAVTEAAEEAAVPSVDEKQKISDHMAQLLREYEDLLHAQPQLMLPSAKLYVRQRSEPIPAILDCLITASEKPLDAPTIAHLSTQLSDIEAVLSQLLKGLQQPSVLAPELKNFFQQRPLYRNFLFVTQLQRVTKNLQYMLRAFSSYVVDVTTVH